MKSKILKKMLAIALVCVLMVMSMGAYVKTDGKNSEKNIFPLITSEEFLRFNNVLKYDSKGKNLDISKFKEIYGIDNVYLLIEYSPIGYAVYDRKNEIFLEYSNQSYSPIQNYETSNYYGLGRFFLEKDGELINAITNKKTNHEGIERLKSNMKQIEDKSEFKKLRYERQQIQSSSQVRLSNGYYFQNLLKFGYNDNGSCGYLAGAILLSYYSTYHNRNIVSHEYFSPYVSNVSSLMYMDEMPALSDNLRLDLMEIGEEVLLSRWETIDGVREFNYGTVPGEMKKVLNKYFDNKNINYSVNSNIITSGSKVRSIIHEERPLLLFGDIRLPGITSYSPHVVVCYGYIPNGLDTNYVVHFGYEDFSHVVVNSIVILGGTVDIEN